jgi:protease-4
MTDQDQQALERVLQATVTEQRRARRWRIFFRFVYLILFVVILNALFVSPNSNGLNHNEAHVALITINGIITGDSMQTNADSIMTALDDAFKDKNTKAVILEINSPGGSAVEAGRIYDEILRLRKLQPDIKVYAVIDELGASAAYYIASAADDIYANRASLVGSIGVKIDGFGFVDLMQKVGVERRLITAGQDKGFLDPFSPLSAQDTQYAQALIDNVYVQFKTAVQNGRKDRLSDNPDIFSGLVWTGEQAKQLGLVDNLGDAHYVAREVVGVDNLVTFNPPLNLIDMFAMEVGASFAQVLTKQSGIQF